MASAVTLFSLIVFLPAATALLLCFIPKERSETIKLVSLAATIVVFLLTLYTAVPQPEGMEGPGFQFGEAARYMQDAFSIGWIDAFNIYYAMGIDGISFPLLVLTAFISMLAMWASWNITRQIKAYCILFLLLETGMLGVFLALDFFLFYVFWEVMLLPMYFLIGVWGGPRREYAAIKFFLYTLLGSVLMLVAILMLYYNSNLVTLAKVNERLPPAQRFWQQLNLDPSLSSARLAQLDEREHVVHTFNLLALAEMGQRTDLFDRDPFVLRVFGSEWFRGWSVQWWAFLLLFIGFAIKVPAVPVHTWLPDAHVEAPTPISMILAGILLKMGGYGIIRICYPVCPQAGFELAWFVTGVGVVSMLYGAFAAMAQKDFKRLVAYSSVSHMGYVLLGMGVWSATAGNNFRPDYWSMGMNGAMFQMIAHGISSPGMFFLVGVIYDRVHHRNLDEFGGLFARMPVYSGLAIGIFFAGLGLPGLCGFIGEVFVTLSAWSYSRTLAVISASTVILTAGYILWTLQRVYLGPEYRGPHADHITPMTFREGAIASLLLAPAILLGVLPNIVFAYMRPSVERSVQQLARWTRQFEARQPLGTAELRQHMLPAASAPLHAATALPQADQPLARLKDAGLARDSAQHFTPNPEELP
jgi:NADH-quinone oxidoreductase subunit M